MGTSEEEEDAETAEKGCAAPSSGSVSRQPTPLSSRGNASKRPPKRPRRASAARKGPPRPAPVVVRQQQQQQSSTLAEGDRRPLPALPPLFPI